ncbi:hypothetical protein ACFLSS_02510, partial [Bacteroidota bacterium]
MILPQMKKNVFISILIIVLLICLTACYSSDVITVPEFNRIEATDKPDEIRVTTKDSTTHHFVK